MILSFFGQEKAKLAIFLKKMVILLFQVGLNFNLQDSKIVKISRLKCPKLH